MTKINTKTLSLQAAGYIREAIRNKQLQPGDKLTELAIADELSTSQGPVREALQMLVSEGLVRIRGKREKHVAMPSAKAVGAEISTLFYAKIKSLIKKFVRCLWLITHAIWYEPLPI